MRSRNGGLSIVGALVTVVLIGGLPTGVVVAEEFDELTPAAAHAVKTLFPDATVMGVGQERERDVVYYEVVVRDEGRRIEVEVAPDGAIGEIESVVAMADVPQAAREQILRNTRGTDIKQVERHEVRGVPKDGTFVPVDRPTVLYEVEYDDRGRSREFMVAEDGTRSADDESEDDAEDESGD